MIIITCVDNNFGMQFNKRRQSRDINVIKRIYEITKNKRLFISDFSKDLFEKDKVITTDKFFINANDDDYFFIESPECCDLSKVNKIILFFWNTVYPADLKFIMPKGFEPVCSKEFSGNSHEKITEVVYEKK